MWRKLLPLLLLAACASSHAPPFATQPYAPFSRGAAVAIALDEWRLWGSVVDDSDGEGYVRDPANVPQRQQGLWQRVGEYWWEGMNTAEPDARLTGLHNTDGDVVPVSQKRLYPWSAAFISYVMRIAGAGPDFPYAPDHAAYINAGARGARLLTAEDPALYAPRLGDLVCFSRGAKLKFADLPTTTFFPAHCAIVVGGGPGTLTIVGGNVDDAVVESHLAANLDGRLGPNPQHWFVVLRVNYAAL